MTSNQLSYWKLQEEKRSNKEEERIKDQANKLKAIQNDLEARGLDIRDKQLLLQLTELYTKEGAASFSKLPDDLQEKLRDTYDADVTDKRDFTFSDFMGNLFGAIGNFLSDGGAKIIGALF